MSTIPAAASLPPEPSEGDLCDAATEHALTSPAPQLRPLVPGESPPNWEDPVPLNVVGPAAVPFGLP